MSTNNRSSIDNWFIINNNKKLIPGIMYQFNREMKDNHLKNKCLLTVKPNCIYVDNNQIEFNDAIILNSNDQNMKNKNIEEMCSYFIGRYLEFNDANGLMNTEVLKNRFDAYSYLFEENEREYFQTILLDGFYIYYSDFIDKKKSSQGLNKEVNKTLIKGSEINKTLTYDEEAGNISYVLIMTITGFITLLGSLMFIYAFILK